MCIFHPFRFFSLVGESKIQVSPMAFSIGCSMIFALFLSFEIWLEQGTTDGMALFLVGFLVVTLPIASILWTYCWSGFIQLCVVLMGETIDFRSLKNIVAYSTWGLLPVFLVWGHGQWLAIWYVWLQFIGLRKVLNYSPWVSGIYAVFPFSIVIVFGILFTSMFKVF
jgi:hypothetical protein